MSDDQIYDELDLESLDIVGPTEVEESDDNSSNYYFDDIFDDISYNESNNDTEQLLETDSSNLAESKFDIYEELFA